MRRLIAVGIMLLASTGWASAGWADTAKTININPGSLNKTADEFEEICDANQGGKPPAGMDMWVFNLPKQGNEPGVFVSVTATWDTGSGSKTLTIPADGGAISAPANNGTSKAWIAVPEGWTLTAASAVITGEASMFVVTHTCLGTTSENPPNSPTPDPTAPPTPPGGGGGGGGGGAGPSLPVTGATVGVLVTIGTLAIAGGAALLFLYRRRRPIV